MELKKVKILGVSIHNVTLESASKRVLDMVRSGRACSVYTPNTEIVMEAQKDDGLKAVLNRGDLVIPDGIGLVIASNIHRLGLSDRVPGIELMGEILKMAEKERLSVFLFGAKPGIAKRASENILKSHPGLAIAGVRDGYFTESQADSVLDEINAANPDILFVALGAPKQEKWIDTNLSRLNAKIVMGVGGSIDVHAGVAKRAPVIFQKLYLEWFYRLMKDPHRIGRMMSLPKFLAISILSKNFYKEEN
jgi:N-acetylglucosaminyldiphosphoundecaprenol N-acetyl-beta-D-mannosaminyltransferase